MTPRYYTWNSVCRTPLFFCSPRPVKNRCYVKNFTYDVIFFTYDVIFFTYDVIFFTYDVIFFT